MAPSGIAHQGNEDHTLASMMAWRVHEFGPPDVMRFERILRPHPSPGEVLVKVKAAGVGPWDGWIRAGKSALPQPLPHSGLGSVRRSRRRGVGGSACGRSGLWCYESPVYRGLCRVCFGFRSDGLEEANLTNPY